MRNVGPESSKTWQIKQNTGFFKDFMPGVGLDIGYRGDKKDAESILPGAIGIELDYPGYDGKTLPFPDKSQDYVYSSHCLEHISDYKAAIQEWFRVLKPGGHMVTVVPHRDLYEKKLTLPSNWNGDHKRFYTPASFLKEFEDSLPVNSFRVRHLHDNDFGHDYNDPPTVHGRWLYEIELVIQKL